MASPMIRYSIIICTYNRPFELNQTLNNLLTEVVDPQVEFLVIDNAAQIAVDQIVNNQTNLFNNIHYFSETDVGLTKARNRGGLEARGEWLIYLDDDVDVKEGWFNEISTCLETRPRIGALGGKVDLAFPESPPAWLTRDHYHALSYCDFDNFSVAGPLDFPAQQIVGANFCVKKSILEQFGGFQPSLGRMGEMLLSGEETFLLHQIHGSGLEIWYAPNAVVSHRIPRERMQKSFFEKRYYWNGCTNAVLLNELKRHRLKTMTFLDYQKHLARQLLYALIKKRSLLFTRLALLDCKGFYNCYFRKLDINNSPGIVLL